MPHAWYMPGPMIADPTGAAKVAFNYWNPSNTWAVGLITTLDNRTSAWVSGPHLDQFTWGQDSGGNPYIASTTTYLDQGTSSQRVSTKTATPDSHGYGNVVSSSIYDYAPSSPTLSRTTTTTYLHDSNSAYDNAFIRNRVLTQTVTPAGGSALTMVNNAYDQYGQWPAY